MIRTRDTTKTLLTLKEQISCLYINIYSYIKLYRETNEFKLIKDKSAREPAHVVCSFGRFFYFLMD